MEEIFKTIFNAVKALSWLKQVSADEGQLEAVNENGDAEVTALLPCLLIDTNQTSWEAGDLLNQYGSTSIFTRYAYRKTADQSNLTKDTLFAASITSLKKRMDIEKAIAKAVPSAGHGRFSRVLTEREKRSDGIIVIRTTWSCSVSESLA